MEDTSGETLSIIQHAPRFVVKHRPDLREDWSFDGLQANVADIDRTKRTTAGFTRWGGMASGCIDFNCMSCRVNTPIDGVVMIGSDNR